MKTVPPEFVRAKIAALFDELLQHEGFGDLQVEVRLFRRGCKEVILHAGRQHRYVVSMPSAPGPGEPPDPK